MEAHIDTSELVEAIRDTFIAELTAIPEDTYTKTGSPISETEFEKALVYADAVVRQSQERFLLPGPHRVTHPGENLPETVIYIFRGAGRRLAGKPNYLADMLHDAMKEAALSRLFSTIDADLSGKHATSSADILATLTKSLYTKLPPHRSA